MKILFLLTLLVSCSSLNFEKTVDQLDIKKFMGDWYVIIGRTTFFEKNAHNSIETYTWNEQEKRIDILFNFKKGSFDAELETMSQRGWIYNKESNAHWKISPLWPFKLDYLIIALAEDYSWTAVGVPSGRYLWIMSRDYKMDQKQVEEIIQKVALLGYPVHDLVQIPHRY